MIYNNDNTNPTPEEIKAEIKKRNRLSKKPRLSAKDEASQKEKWETWRSEIELLESQFDPDFVEKYPDEDENPSA